MSLTQSEVKSIIKSLPFDRQMKVLKLMRQLQNDESAEARRMYRDIIQATTAVSKAQGKKRDTYIKVLTKFIDDLGPASREEKISRVLKQSRSDSDKAATALKQLAQEQQPSDAERSLITNTGKLSLASYYTAPLKPGDTPRAIPTKSVGAYAIFGRLVDDSELTPRLDDYVNQEVSLDLGEQLVENKAAAETAIRDNIKTFLTEDSQGKQLMQRIAARGGATYTSHSSAITDALAQSLANSISIRSRQAYYENQQSEANDNIAALESGKASRVDDVIAREHTNYLQEAQALTEQVLGLAETYYPETDAQAPPASGSDKISAEVASTLSGNSLDEFMSFLGSDPDAARSLSWTLDPI